MPDQDRDLRTRSLDVTADLTITLHEDGRALACSEVGVRPEVEVHAAIRRWQQNVAFARRWLAIRGVRKRWTRADKRTHTPEEDS